MWSVGRYFDNILRRRSSRDVGWLLNMLSTVTYRVLQDSLGVVLDAVIPVTIKEIASF